MEVTIHLPETWKTFVENQVTSGAHGSPANYLLALVEKDRQRQAREQVEVMLIEALNNTDEREWTPEVLAELRAEVAEDQPR